MLDTAKDQEGLIAVGHEHEGLAMGGEVEHADVVAERVGAILGAAEEAAAAMRQEAEQALERRRAEAEHEAERMLADARAEADAIVGEQVAQARELARTLVGRATELLRRLEDAEAVKASVAGLLGELDDVTSRMTGLPGGNGGDREPTRAETAQPARLEPIEEARLMALQMAMSGRTRAEVEADLRHGLRVEDPETVLDDVFGKGTPGSQRIPWSGLAKGEAP